MLLTGLYRLRKLFDKFPPSRLVNLLLAGFFRLRKLISPEPVVSFFRGLVGWASASEVHQRWTEKDSSNPDFGRLDPHVPVDEETPPGSRPPPSSASEVQHERWTGKDSSNPDYDRLTPHVPVDKETLLGSRPPHNNASEVHQPERWIEKDFSNPDFDILPQNIRIEEETNDVEQYYPVRIGDVFHSRYQVVGKLGFGMTSTVWLARDLNECRYVALKVYVFKAPIELLELVAHKRLEKGPKDHPGRNAIRSLLDSFKITGPNGEHHCLVYEPLWNDINYWLRSTSDRRLPPNLLVTVLKQVFLALDYAHKCQVIHADIKGNNIMFTITDTTLFEQYEKQELECPSPRKEVNGRIIYATRPIGGSENPADLGVPILCDFGSAVFGGEPQHNNAQPNGYRSPEVILGVPWSYEIDIWNVGCMAWWLSQGKPLLHGLSRQSVPKSIAIFRYHRDLHLSQMISLLGPPSPEFLARGSESSEFFSPDGAFVANIPIPPPKSLADREKALKDGEGEGADRDSFLCFIGKMLQWDPRDRQTAEQLLEDEWLKSRLSKQEETK